MHHVCTLITLFRTFLWRRCTTTTWNGPTSRFVWDVNTGQRFSFPFPELWYSPLELISRKIRQNLSNWTKWNKRDKVWSSMNSLFKWLFCSRRRSCCSLWGSRKWNIIWVLNAQAFVVVVVICMYYFRTGRTVGGERRYHLRWKMGCKSQWRTHFQRTPSRGHR